jgi:B12 binding protein
MRVLLLNVPHPSIGSRIPDDHLPPLGLLSIGGPLIDDGHEVRLLDADLEAGRCTTYSAEKVAAEAVGWRPDAVLFGHSGSTSAHPVVAEVSRAVRRLLPPATIVYGGVFPTYHWREFWGAPQDAEERSMQVAGASLRDLIEKPHERQRRLVHARDLRIAAVDQEEFVRRMGAGAVARAETAGG